jgi:membrane-associated phospholipid phosphatase
MVRYWIAALGSAAAFAAVYVLFVRTVTGQRWENAVLEGRSSASGAQLRTADMRLDQITVETLVVAVLLIVGIGLIRHRVLLALGAAGVVCVALVLAEVLKRELLTRPDIVGAPRSVAHNSFPSGHTTIAVSLMFALIIVVPYGIRPWVALAAAAWGVGISGYTVTAGWHRPSDTIGAALLVVVVACLMAGFMVAVGHAGAADPGGAFWEWLRYLTVAPIALAAAIGLSFGVAFGAYSWHELNDPGADVVTAEDNAYTAGRALAIGASAAAVLALLVLLRHHDLGVTRSEKQAHDPEATVAGHDF